MSNINYENPNFDFCVVKILFSVQVFRFYMPNNIQIVHFNYDQLYFIEQPAYINQTGNIDTLGESCSHSRIDLVLSFHPPQAAIISTCTACLNEMSV